MTQSDTPQPARVPRRRRLGLWMFLCVAAAAHAAFILGLSPGLGRGDAASPENLLRKARDLVGQGKYAEAVEVYQILLARKPETPLVFTEAEKELHDIRIKAAEARRTEQQAAAKAPDQPPGKTGDAPPATPGTGKAPEKTKEQPAGKEAAPKVDLPQLPDIGP